MAFTLEQTDYAGIEHFVPHTKGTMLEFGKRTTYYKAIADGVEVGFCGIVWMANGAKFKNDFVLPEHRGRGHFKRMVSERLALVSARGIAKVMACCTPMSVRHYVEVGFEPIRRYKNGCTEVVRIASA